LKQLLHDGTISLVIFDCDGVLVDSEMLSAGVLMRMMEEEGLPISPDIFRNDFLGRSFAAAAARASQRFGRPLPDDFQLRYRERLLQRMAGELHAMDGVADVLEALHVPFCLATSSSPQRLLLSLKVTALDKYFRNRTFTSSEVQFGKPAPDLFLHAASKCGVDPAKCLVIEDSEMGVRSAIAAGMKVWHFTGGAHVRAGYRLPIEVVPNRIVRDMVELRKAFAHLGLCQETSYP
jgi:HAD superfamily hydrolase (TIGR01509 family)